jgi:shikimate dehydrogenase
VRVSGHTLVFGLVGHPVRHSLSPTMHTHLFEQEGIDAIYMAFDVHPERANRVADAIRTLDIRGVNLTVPFKAAILPDLDHVTRAAKEAQAVNVVIQHDGFLTGYNTDGEGFARAFEADFGSGAIAGHHAVVLGAGGAGRAVAAGLADRGAAGVTLLNRTQTRAESAVASLAAYFPNTDFVVGPLSSEAFAQRAAACSVVVNCTSGPGAEAVGGFEPRVLSDDTIWCDINYWMPDPPLLATCKSIGLRTQNGLPMLIEQGALSFELFTGVPVDARSIYEHLQSGPDYSPG